LGYSETLTQKALLKVGLAAAQNELLDELIRLQHIRAVDPKVFKKKKILVGRNSLFFDGFDF
jgi:hypothetical protein